MRSLCAHLVGLAVLVAPPVCAQSVTIVSGDTISQDGTTYRLWGIEAPDPHQTCMKGWPAGEEAVRVLEELIADRPVSCEPRDKDRSGRTRAICQADGTDLGAAMVRSGFAWAQLGQSKGYVLEETRAAGERKGVHAHRCQTAANWRVKNPRPFEQQEGGPRDRN